MDEVGIKLSWYISRSTKFKKEKKNMELCNDGHNEIVYQTKECPLCTAKEEIETLYEEIETLREEMKEKNEENKANEDDIKILIEEIKILKEEIKLKRGEKE